MKIVGYVLIFLGTIMMIVSRAWSLDVRRLPSWTSVFVTTLLVVLGGLILWAGCQLAGLTTDFLKK
jgi:uncharacterized membrane protein